MRPKALTCKARSGWSNKAPRTRDRVAPSKYAAIDIMFSILLHLKHE